MKKVMIILAVIGVGLALFAAGLFLYVRNMLSKPVLYNVPGMEEVAVNKNQVYKTLPDRELCFDLYSPKNAVAGHGLPAVILVHGAGPEFMIENAKDWKCFETYGQLLAASGLKAVAFNHRGNISFANIRQEAQDVDDLIAHIRTESGRLGIDPRKLCLFVFSAGGPCISNVLQAKPDYLSCLVAYYAVLDLAVLPHSFIRGMSPQDLEDFSPVMQLRNHPEKLPPLLVVKAGKDMTREIPAGMDHFVAEARAQGVPVTYLVHEQGKHGFDMLNDDAKTKAIIAETIRFIQMHTAGER
ncbi:MAG: alpha/beta hydrolase [candidate division FCPU426 bacterium]